jgi:two-component system cell cycle sensor histidine kinase/response regulator CckA
MKLLQRLIGEDIEVSLSTDDELGLAKIDPGQFEQAIINLAVNARDAMPQAAV